MNLHGSRTQTDHNRHSPRSLEMFIPSNSSPTRICPFAVCAVLLLTGLSPRANNASAFVSSPPCRSPQRNDDASFFMRRVKLSERNLWTPIHSPLEDSPWQEEDSYYDRLLEASKDPVAFEKFVEESTMSSRDGGGKKSSVAPSSSPIEGATGVDGGG